MPDGAFVIVQFLSTALGQCFKNTCSLSIWMDNELQSQEVTDTQLHRAEEQRKCGRMSLISPFKVLLFFSHCLMIFSTSLVRIISNACQFFQYGWLSRCVLVFTFRLYYCISDLALMHTTCLLTAFLNGVKAD